MNGKTNTNDYRQQITGAILAGGRGTRVGGRDKGLIDVDGRPLVEHVLTRLKPQVADVVIAANRNVERYSAYGFAVVPDQQGGYPGPLAGIASALSRAATSYVLVVPCDGPYLPRELAARLHRRLADTGAQIAVADSGGRLQRLHALMQVSLLPNLRRFIADGGRAVHEWQARHVVARADFSDCASAFANFNTSAEIASYAPLPSGEEPGAKARTVIELKQTDHSGLPAPSPQPLSRGEKSSVEDRLNRPLRDLRISVTDRCNFRCVYCMPRARFGAAHRFLPRDDLLTFEEIKRIARVAVTLGVHKIRLTGGEPLLRRDIEKLIAMLAAIDGIDDIALTSNGSLLVDKARALGDAGLQRVTVSLDTLDDNRFRRMADTVTPVASVMAGIDAATRAGLAPIKINMVVKRGANDRDVLAMANRFRHSGHVLRFIEYMDVGNSNGWRLDNVMTAADIRDAIDKQWPLTPLQPHYDGEVAQRYRYRDGGGEIGFITSISQPFCGACTRARLSAEGKLYTCLFAGEGFDLRVLLRDGISDDNLQRRLSDLWMRRDDRYSELRAAQTTPTNKIEMSYIGG